MPDSRRLNKYYEMIFSTELDENSIDRVIKAMSDFNVVGSDLVETGFVSGCYGDVQSTRVGDLRNTTTLAGFLAEQKNQHKRKQYYIKFADENLPNIGVVLTGLFLRQNYSLDSISVTFKLDKNPHKIFHFDLNSISSLDDLAGILMDRESYFADRYAYFDFDFSRKGSEPFSFRLYRIKNDCYVSGLIHPELMAGLFVHYLEASRDDGHPQQVL